MILTRHNKTAQAIRAFFGRRIALWEGYTRSALDQLVQTVMSATPGDRTVLAAAVVAFMGDIGKGFSPSAFGNRFEAEVANGCSKPCKGKPALIQELARFIVDDPSHKGVAKTLQRIAEFKASGTPEFSDVEVDLHREFWDAVRLGSFDSADVGHAEITHRRTFARPKPPARAISTIHKAKGLECEGVIVVPCDNRTFPDKPDARCLLYVALSRAKSELLLVLSRSNPSPLFDLPS